MNKVPVMRTIEEAYGFAFGRFFTVLGVVWLPWVILYGFMFGVPMLFGTSMLNLLFYQFDSQAPAFAPWYVLGIRVLPYLIGAMVTAGVMERALGLVSGPTFFYFSLGRPVWRMIGAWFLAFVFFMFAVLIAVIACVAVVAVSALLVGAGMDKAPSSGGIWAGLIAAIVVIGIVVGLIYFALRLLFLLPAVVIAEKRIGLERTLQLSKGNAWRFFLIALGIILPFIVAEIVLGGILIGTRLPQLISAFQTLPIPKHSDPTPDQIGAIMRGIFATLFNVYGSMLYVLGAIFAVLGIFAAGLKAGASSAAYRALVPEAPMPQSEESPAPPPESPPPPVEVAADDAPPEDMRGEPAPA